MNLIQLKLNPQLSNSWMRITNLMTQRGAGEERILEYPPHRLIFQGAHKRRNGYQETLSDSQRMQVCPT